MLLHEYLKRSARRLPGKIALVCGEQRITYQALERDADAMAGYFSRSGLIKGDRVAIYLENSPESVVAIFGALAAGGCIVAINPATQQDRLGIILENCAPKFLISSVDKLGTIQSSLGAIADHPTIILTGMGADTSDAINFSTALERRDQFVPPRLIDMDLAAIIYTSGSTGRPKGVTHIHRSVETACVSIEEYLENGEQDIILNFLPLSSSYGLLQLLVTFRTGGTLVLEKGFGFPYELIKRIKEEKVTGFAGAPTVYALLLKLDGLEKEDFSSLRYITNAAAAMPVSFIPRLRKVFPTTRIFLMHGLTECLRTTYLPPEEIDVHAASVGNGMSNVELWVEDEDGKRLPPGHPGEMIVRSTSMMAGYWNDPEGTAKALIPGPYPWERVLRTKDLFTMDERGYFWFVARSDELIKSKGEKVSPIEVEDVIYTLEGVMEVRVIGVPDPILGKAIRAEIVLKDGFTLTLKEVKSHCRRYLEDFKIPQQVEFVASLPKTLGGKIKR